MNIGLGMDDNCCTVRETFSNVCGHVTTVTEHLNHCDLYYHDPYSDFNGTGNAMQPSLPEHCSRKCRWTGVQIILGKCMYCEAVAQSPSTPRDNVPFLLPTNTWISDLGVGGYKEISDAELESRRKFFKDYVSDQEILFKRQARMNTMYKDAVSLLAKYDDEVPAHEVVPAQRAELSARVVKTKLMHEWYDVAQNLYLGEVRCLKPSEVKCLLDPKSLLSLTHDLLRLVKREDIPSGEVCAICREDLDGSEQNREVTRVFCGSHLFHHQCIVLWFTPDAQNVSCPMCRRTRQVYHVPDWDAFNDPDIDPFDERLDDWHDPFDVDD